MNWHATFMLKIFIVVLRRF